MITDPKQINDPLSEALASVATGVNKLRERVQKLEGPGFASEPLPASLWQVAEKRATIAERYSSYQLGLWKEYSFS